MSKPAITLQQSHARKDQLEGALINADPSLSSEALLATADGKKSFLPLFRPATQATGGAVAFQPRLEADGALTFYLEAVAPPGLAALVADARPRTENTSFALVLNASGASIPLTATRENGDNIWRISDKLAGDALKMVRDALFDQSPNVSIEILRSLRLAAPLSEQFVTENWSDSRVRAGLLKQFGEIPSFDSPSLFYSFITESVPGYASGYIVFNCTYTDRITAPPLPGYVLRTVGEYDYYQDNQDRSRFFYLPDKFELAKEPTDLPSISLLEFIPAEGQDAVKVEKTRARFRFYGKPVVKNDRIERARRALGTQFGCAAQMISLQDAHNVATKFTQSLPNAEGIGANPRVQPNADINLSTGMRNELLLEFPQYQALWDAIFSTNKDNPLFRGWVDVDLLNGKYSKRIDFDGRLPKEQAKTYFYELTGIAQSITYSTAFTVNAYSQVFDPKPLNRQVLELELTFVPQTVVRLSKTKPTEPFQTASFELRRSIRDIVLGNQGTGRYPYRLRVIRADESITCCDRVTEDTNFYLRSQDVDDCKGTCP
jgi:hypothetical protein